MTSQTYSKTSPIALAPLTSFSNDINNKLIRGETINEDKTSTNRNWIELPTRIALGRLIDLAAKCGTKTIIHYRIIHHLGLPKDGL
ncbi:hypothetical protein RRG08_046652 [Elysia crispata]|uniref:Uncharacterized protein n=1 Tax=Elysia crispata TaxID=231223 RepID=A0AAE1E4A7_9GAST|nr:hypothetical protein RRG08_046652 [Elysia crispata]